MRLLLFYFLHRALYSHFTGLLGAASCDQPAKPFMAEVVGAAYEHEITLMNSLTVNLHLMMQVISTVGVLSDKLYMFKDMIFPLPNNITQFCHFRHFIVPLNPGTRS